VDNVLPMRKRLFLGLLSTSFTFFGIAGCADTVIVDPAAQSGSANGDGTDDDVDDGTDDDVDDDTDDDVDDDTDDDVDEPTCDPISVPDAQSCEAPTVAQALTQTEAAQALVGSWYRCNPEAGGMFPVGVVFFPDGRFQVLDESNDTLTCSTGFDDEGRWELEDHSGIGAPDKYSLNIEWAGGGFNGAFVYFANDEGVLRLAGMVADEDLVRVQ